MPVAPNVHASVERYHYIASSWSMNLLRKTSSSSGIACRPTCAHEEASDFFFFTRVSATRIRSVVDRTTSSLHPACSPYTRIQPVDNGPYSREETNKETFEQKPTYLFAFNLAQYPSPFSSGATSSDVREVKLRFTNLQETEIYNFLESLRDLGKLRRIEESLRDFRECRRTKDFFIRLIIWFVSSIF